jgi:hypothetical protein
MPVPVDYSAYQQAVPYQPPPPPQNPVQFEITTQPFYQPQPEPTTYALQPVAQTTQVEAVAFPSQSFGPVVEQQNQYIPGLPPGAKIVAEYFLGYLDDPAVQQQAQEFQVEARAFQTEPQYDCQPACQPAPPPCPVQCQPQYECSQPCQETVQQYDQSCQQYDQQCQQYQQYQYQPPCPVPAPTCQYNYPQYQSYQWCVYNLFYFKIIN